MLKAENFRESIIEIINSSDLEPVIIYYILKDIMNNIEKSYQNLLIMESKKNIESICIQEQRE